MKEKDWSISKVKKKKLSSDHVKCVLQIMSNMPKQTDKQLEPHVFLR